MCRTTAKKLSSSDVSTSRDWLDDIAGLETHKGVGSAWLKQQPCALAPRPVILAGTASAGVYQDCCLPRRHIRWAVSQVSGVQQLQHCA